MMTKPVGMQMELPAPVKKARDPLAGVRLECSTCHRMYPIKDRDKHGPTTPRCLHRRSVAWMQENQYRTAGSFMAVLREAGLVRMVPFYVWYTIFLDANGNEVHWRDSRMMARKPVEYASFVAVAPVWAYDLAHKLSRDKTIGRQLGYVQKRQQVTVKRAVYSKGTQLQPAVKEWRDVDIDKVLPLRIRAEILGVAARNTLARELIMDDPVAASRIIRDCA